MPQNENLPKLCDYSHTIFEFLKIERSLKNFHEFFRLFFILKVFLRRSNTNTKEGAVADDGVVVTLILGSLLGYMLEQLQLHRSFFFSTP